MDLSVLNFSITQALTADGWVTCIEDNLPDLQQLACSHPSSPLDVFSRLDVLIMTPGHSPETVTGVCLCFLYYADPARVMDMRSLGRLIRHDPTNTIQTHCESIINAAGISSSAPSITVITNPKQEKIKFDAERYCYPAFLVEFDYWLQRETCLTTMQSHVETLS